MKLCPACNQIWDDGLVFCPTDASLLEAYDPRPRRNSHCSYCGAAFEAGAAWPRTCGTCASISYLNPIPVAVLVVPVDGGLLAVRRNFGPAKGKLALPGGFVDAHETWQQAAARELFEETGATVDPASVELYRAHSAPEDAVLLVFGRVPPVVGLDLAAFVPNDEVSELVVLRAFEELAFSTHTAVARDYFDGR